MLLCFWLEVTLALDGMAGTLGYMQLCWTKSEGTWLHVRLAAIYAFNCASCAARAVGSMSPPSAGKDSRHSNEEVGLKFQSTRYLLEWPMLSAECHL